MSRDEGENIMKTKWSLIGTAALLLAQTASATPSIEAMFIKQYPQAANSALQSCATCHMPMKEGNINPYGAALKNAKYNFAAIETLDSDGDGKSNLEEITTFTNPGSQAMENEIFLFLSRMPTVRFNHAAHLTASEYGINADCTHCHNRQGLTFPQAYDAKTLVKDQAHSICVDCHRSSGNPEAPTQCAGCHKK